MRDYAKIFLGLLAVMGIIVMALFWPEDVPAPDPFKPVDVFNDINALGNAATPSTLFDTLKLHNVESSREDIQSGEFRYKQDFIPWRFTTPIDWNKSAVDIETRRVLQRWALSDPFLQAFEKDKQAGDINQAIFFALDWQDYHQRRGLLSPHAWDEDAVRARTTKLAYILSAIENGEVNSPPSTVQKLISLSDFHIQRVTDPEQGVNQATILDTPEFEGLCAVLDALPNCQKE